MIAWDPASITCDLRSAAAVIAPTLEAVEIEPHMTNTSELVLACGAFLDAVDAGSLSHSSQRALNDGAVSAVKRELAGGFAWDRAPGITELTAASLAAWSLLSSTTTEPKWSLPPLMDTSSGGYREEPFRDLDKIPF